MKGNFVEIRNLSSWGGDIVIDILSPRRYLNFIERGSDREGIEGISAVDDYRGDGS
jgi:hypothetical protein